MIYDLLLNGGSSPVPQVTSDISLSLDGFAAGQSDDRLHRWMFEHPDVPENAAAIAGFNGAGAYIMGDHWKGWWGDDPPFDAPVFVVTDGIESALEQARAAAGDGSVAIAGGAATVNQYLAAGLIDELRLHIVPIAIGAGERLFDGVGRLDLEPLQLTSNELVTHQRYRVVR